MLITFTAYRGEPVSINPAGVRSVERSDATNPDDAFSLITYLDGGTVVVRGSAETTTEKLNAAAD